MPKVSDEDLASRRYEILDGARKCFAEFGYDGATVARLEKLLENPVALFSTTSNLKKISF